jgi:tRNA 2-selenouridine synthase
MTWRELDPSGLNNLSRRILIDVRSPCEFAAERIPGAINIPLLDDAERAVVGTIYANEGEVAARRRALTIISPKIPRIVDEILQLKRQDSALVVHCWRGGLRSEAVASFLTIVGIDCWRLRGGYKAWRKMVLNDFANSAMATRFIVLQGLTGTGKTDLLSHLAQKGEAVLDLEALASHRGSIFGAIGLPEQPTQKNFEGELWECMRRLPPGVVFVEAESRKIGRIAVPDFILDGIKNGRKVLVVSEIKQRAKRIAASYAASVSPEAIEQIVAIIVSPPMVERFGKENAGKLTTLVRNQEIEEAVLMLFEHYYDPLYERHIKAWEPFDCTVCSDEIDEAVTALIEFRSTVENGDRSLAGSADRRA